MSDYSELKRLAIAAQNDNGDYVALNDYGMAVPPAVVLALIAENERMREDACFRAVKSLRGDCKDLMAERDQLQAVAELAVKKLRSAEICHPRAVETLVGEAREALAAYLPAGWPDSQVRP